MLIVLLLVWWDSNRFCRCSYRGQQWGESQASCYQIHANSTSERVVQSVCRQLQARRLDWPRGQSSRASYRGARDELYLSFEDSSSVSVLYLASQPELFRLRSRDVR